MQFKEVLLTAAKTAEDRNTAYGTHDECFSRISKIASAFFGEEIDEYKISMILLFVKLGRIGDNKCYADNYVDGVNYLAFASHFADGPANRKTTLSDMIPPSRWSNFPPGRPFSDEAPGARGSE